MSVRILHTSDLHIGLRFRHISNGIARERLVKERIDALRNMVARANEQNCDFFVIAGDLFDRQDIPKGQIEEVVEALTRFNGEVLIIPGNHDFYEGTHSKLWDQFTKGSINTHIQLLVTKEPVELISKDGQTVCFYPCPCPSKHSAQNEIGWVRAVQKAPAHLHMGIAHGNVEGLALDSEGRYFNMHAQELREAGLDCWLLGHVHVPYPQANYTGNPGYFMAGTHTPERINRSTTGQCWFIEFSPEKKIRFEQWVPGTVSFITDSRKLSGQEDVELLETELLQYDAPNTLLTLALTGNLSQAERDILNEMLVSIKERFLDVSVEDDIRQKIDAAQIQTEFSDNTFSQQLLMQLLNAQDPELKVQLAYDIIKGLEK